MPTAPLPPGNDPAVLRPESPCGPSHVRRLGNLVSGVVLAAAGTLLALAGFQSVATALTTAGVHLSVQEVARQLASTPLAQRLNQSPIRAREMRHFGELGVSLALAAAGILVSIAGLSVIGTPLVVVGVDLAVHALAAIREDVVCLEQEKRLRQPQRISRTHTPSAGHHHRPILPTLPRRSLLSTKAPRAALTLP